ncbi:OmpA family protein [Candidatus Moduliflexus flocculans]|uniref:OmpA family protein n=1 Tax=Candidatus Moduliflexus flocculans TaxID=1499966 RepID=A0A0S6W050_9BACT|nr:OmpA family protein [Candidatus Moduliflexus flocculans]
MSLYQPYPPFDCPKELGMYPLLFDEGKATLTQEMMHTLQRLGKILRMPLCDHIRIEVQGHADSTGSERYNIGLANRRARAVTYYLIYDEGITPERIIRSQKLEQGIWTGEGYGENVPISSNDTEKGRALNRRVQFIILPPNER